jgi:hypothetical protein
MRDRTNLFFLERVQTLVRLLHNASDALGERPGVWSSHLFPLRNHLVDERN